MSGCALTFTARDLGVATSLAEPGTDPTAGYAIQRHQSIPSSSYGAGRASRPKRGGRASPVKVGTGPRIANLRIKVRSRWSDLLVHRADGGRAHATAPLRFEGVVVARGCSVATPSFSSGFCTTQKSFRLDPVAR